MNVELIGYIGSMLVVVSMLMTSVVRLRTINTVGSLIFTVYALLIRSYPTAFLNGFLVVINLRQLWRLRSTDVSYQLVRCSAGDSLMTWFIERFHVDMRHYFPSLDGDLPSADAAYAVFCGNEIAGILLGKLEEDGALRIAADYTTPKFRDSSVGTYLYQQLPYEGLSRLIFTGEQPEHVAYISRMGFELRPDGSYVKELA